MFPSTRWRPVTRSRVCSISCRGRGVVGRHWHDLDALDARPGPLDTWKLLSVALGVVCVYPPTHYPKLDLI